MQSANRQTAGGQTSMLVPLSWVGNRLIPELSPGVASEPNRELTILHTNDFHSSVDGRPNAHGQVSGGLARIATTIRQARAAGPTLVLDAGDFVFGEGTWWNAQGTGAVAQLRGMAGCDLATIGNHDLEHGLTSLQELLQGGFPFVSANLHIEHALLQAHVRPAYIANIAGWRIGISGLTTPSTGDLVPSRILQGITFTDPQEAIGRVVQALEPMVDTIVILSHLGFYEDGRGDYGLAVHLTGSKVSLILGGHTHRALDPARTIGGIVICNAGPFGANVNEVKLRWGQHGVIEVRARLLPQDETIADDNSLVAACSDMAQTFRALHETMLALPPLPKVDVTDEGTYVRDRERLLLAKSLSASGKVDPAAILFLPLLYVPRQLPGGEYATLADIATTYANSEYLVEAEINGDKLKELLSLQSSLLYYQQAQPIWLIDETPVLPQQVQDDSTYKVIVTELILEGGLGWSMARDALQHSRLLDITCEQVVLAYLQSADK